jgi:hypothetical protein
MLGVVAVLTENVTLLAVSIFAVTSEGVLDGHWRATTNSD